MYVLKSGIKKDPARRWALPDRIFFGYGACHILAGVYLTDPPLSGFRAERIIPTRGYAGNHIFLSDGVLAFDYHGYCGRANLVAHHRKGWTGLHAGWECTIEPVKFDLLQTSSLNDRKMLGPDQYLHDPIPRARRFLGRIDHITAAATARGNL